MNGLLLSKRQFRERGSRMPRERCLAPGFPDCDWQWNRASAPRLATLFEPRGRIPPDLRLLFPHLEGLSSEGTFANAIVGSVPLTDAAGWLSNVRSTGANAKGFILLSETEIAYGNTATATELRRNVSSVEGLNRGRSLPPKPRSNRHVGMLVLELLPG